MKLIRIILRFALVLILIICLGFIGLTYYVSNHKAQLIQKVEQFFAEQVNGKLIFSDMDVSVWRKFPNVSVEISDLSLKMENVPKHKNQSISAKDVYASVSFKDILNEKVKIQQIHIKNAEFKMETHKHEPFLEGKKKKKKDKNKNLPFKNETDIVIDRFKIFIEDHQKNKRFDIYVETLDGTLVFKDSVLEAEVDIDAIVNELGFNLDKGTFFNRAELSGKVKPKINLEKGEVHIPDFELKIDKQKFVVNAKISSENHGQFHFNLKNKTTNFDAVVGLLSQNIQKKLKPLSFNKGINTNGVIKGGFAPKSNPYIHVKFETSENELTYNKEITMDALNLKGSFTNRSFVQDSLGLENPKDIMLNFQNLEGNIQGINITLSDVIFLSTPETPVFVDANINMQGNPKDLTNLLKNENFFLSDGTFELKSKLKGDISSLKKIIANSDTKVQFANTKVSTEAGKPEIPIERLDLSLANNKVLLNRLLIPFKSGNKVELKGDLENLIHLFSKEDKGKTTATLNVDSDQLSWEDIHSAFQQSSNRTAKKEPKGNLTQMLNKLYDTFNPKLTVSIDTLTYDAYKVIDFNTDIHFETPSELALENTFFTFENGSAKTHARIDYSDTNNIKITANTHVQGETSIVNQIYNSNAFQFLGGKFDFKASIEGDPKDVKKILKEANGALLLDDFKVLYTKHNVMIPIRKMDFEIIEDQAVLNNLSILTPSGKEIQFSGKVNHLHSLLQPKDNVASSVSSSLSISSGSLDFNEFNNLLKPQNAASKKYNKSKHLRAIAQDLYEKFNPSLAVSFKEFSLSNVNLENFNTNFHFSDKNKLYLEKMGFNFQGGYIGLDAHLDIESEDKTLFSFGFESNNIPLKKLLESFDYFGIDALKQVEKLDAIVNSNTVIQGEIDGEGALASETMKGYIAFDIEALKLKNFEPLTKVANKIFKKKRFEDIRFAPLTDTLFVSNNTVEIPQMEIQSTAFEFFVEGHLGFEDKNTNLWLSIPLKNLQSRDVVDIPEKEGYINAGSKVFIEVKRKGNEKPKFKLHLSNKKLYEEKNMLDQYKKEHRNERKQRRKYRREKRSEKRAKN